MASELLTELAMSGDIRAACRVAYAELRREGARRMVVYRLGSGGLDLVASVDENGDWDGPPASLTSPPESVDALLRSKAPSGTALRLPELPDLDGFWALPLVAAGRVSGVLFLDAAPGAQALTVAPMLAAHLRIGLDARELQRLREERYDQLVRAETLAATGMLSAGVAHELNNPLGVVLGLGELLCVDPTLSEDVRADLRVIVENTSRAVRVVEQLLSYGRGGGLDHEVIELTEVLESCVGIFLAKTGERSLTLRRRFMPGHVHVLGDAYLLQQALLAILDNARQAIDGTGRPGAIEVELAPDTTAGRVRVSITDDGPGIGAENMPRIFDPFFTTREVGKGTGMGLALVHRTVRNMGGDIRCESEPGLGASFVIVLDRTPVAA